MKNKILKNLGLSALGFMLAAVMVFAGFGATKVLAAEEPAPTGRPEFVRGNGERGERGKFMRDAMMNSSFSQIMRSLSKDTPDGEVGTFDRAVTGEKIDVSRYSTDDGTVVYTFEYTKNGRETGTMYVDYIPNDEGGYYMDIRYFHYNKKGNANAQLFVRNNCGEDMVYKEMEGENEWIKSATLTGKKLTIYDPLSDIKTKYVSKKKKVSRSTVENLTCYQFINGKKILSYTSECYTIKYSVLDNSTYTKSYCNVFDEDGNVKQTYICVDDNFVQNGLGKTTRIFAWDGSTMHRGRSEGKGNADGSYKAFAYQLFDNENGGKRIVSSTCDARLLYYDEFFDAPEVTNFEIIEGTFHPAKEGEGAKCFGYMMYGDYYECMSGCFADCVGDFNKKEFEFYSIVNAVAVDGKTKKNIRTANYLDIIPHDDGTIYVGYNEYSDIKGTSAVNHKIVLHIDANGNKTVVSDEPNDVKLPK